MLISKFSSSGHEREPTFWLVPPRTGRTRTEKSRPGHLVSHKREAGARPGRRSRGVLGRRDLVGPVEDLLGADPALQPQAPDDRPRPQRAV